MRRPGRAIKKSGHLHRAWRSLSAISQPLCKASCGQPFQQPTQLKKDTLLASVGRSLFSAGLQAEAARLCRERFPREEAARLWRQWIGQAPAGSLDEPANLRMLKQVALAGPEELASHARAWLESSLAAAAAGLPEFLTREQLSQLQREQRSSSRRLPPQL